MSTLKKTVTLKNLANDVDELLMALYVLHTSLFCDERHLEGPIISEEGRELSTNLSQAIEELEEYNKETIEYAHGQSTKDLDVAAIDIQGHNFLLYYFLLVEKSLGTVKRIIDTKFSQPVTIETVSNVKSIVERITES